MRCWPTKRGWKRLAIGLSIVVALGLIANASMAWFTERRLQKKIAAVRADGDPASIRDLAPEPIADAENAAVYLDRIEASLDAFDKDCGQFGESAPGKAYFQSQIRGEPATSEQIAAVRAILEKYPEIDSGLAEASACQKYASRLDFSLGHAEFLEEILPAMTRIRSVARFVQWKAWILTIDGQSKEAAERGIRLLRLVRLHESEPTVIAFLVAAAARGIASTTLYDTLAAGTITTEQHAALDSELARHDDPHRLVRALKTERAFGISAFDSLLGRANPVLNKLLAWPIKRDWILVLDYYDVLLPLTARPWLEAHEQVGDTLSAPERENSGTMAQMIMPAIQSIYDANARNLTVVRALRVFNAMRQYAEQNGHDARDLSDLSLPGRATIDPFSGEPLRRKHVDEGWIIYSVMHNGIDDDGDFVQLKDFGLAPRGHRATEKRD